MIWIDHVSSRYYLTMAQGFSNYLDSGQSPVVGQWQHVAATYDGTNARFYIDVADTDGKVVNWNLELSSPNYLKRAGWSSTSLKPGDEVSVEGSLARSGANMANARLVTFPDGTRVFARSAQDGG